MAPNTQIGMVEIPNQIYENENPSGDDKFSRGGAFLEDLRSGDYLDFCKRWFKMGGYLELYYDLQEYFTTIKNPSTLLRAFTEDGLIIPFSFDNMDYIVPIIKDDDLIKPFTIYKVRS